MGRTWVLDTETKGTGARMVPLESVEKRTSTVEPVFVPRKPSRPREPAAQTPAAPRRFTVVDLMTRQRIVDGAGVKETVDAFRSVRSIVDVDVYIWQEQPARWRRLTIGERRALWDLAHP
jgi:hypothetical protein